MVVVMMMLRMVVMMRAMSALYARGPLRDGPISSSSLSPSSSSSWRERCGALRCGTLLLPYGGVGDRAVGSQAGSQALKQAGR